MDEFEVTAKTTEMGKLEAFKERLLDKVNALLKEDE